MNEEYYLESYYEKYGWTTIMYGNWGGWLRLLEDFEHEIILYPKQKSRLVRDLNGITSIIISHDIT